MWTRRAWLWGSGLLLARLALPRTPHSVDTVEIHMRSDPLGTEVWFDPTGI